MTLHAPFPETQSDAEAWREIAARHRQYVERHSKCVDRDDRLRRAEMYEKWADEQDAIERAQEQRS